MKAEGEVVLSDIDTLWLNEGLSVVMFSTVSTGIFIESFDFPSMLSNFLSFSFFSLSSLKFKFKFKCDHVSFKN